MFLGGAWFSLYDWRRQAVAKYLIRRSGNLYNSRLDLEGHVYHAQNLYLLCNSQGGLVNSYIAEYPSGVRFKEGTITSTVYCTHVYISRFSFLLWLFSLSAATNILTRFVETFYKSREEIERQAEAEKEILEKRKMNIKQNGNL